MYNTNIKYALLKLYTPPNRKHNASPLNKKNNVGCEKVTLLVY